VLQNQLFDLIKWSHGFKAFVTAMFMALIIFIFSIRKKKLMYLWLRVTHSCNLPDINEKLHRIHYLFVFTNSTITRYQHLTQLSKEDYQLDKGKNGSSFIFL